VRLVRLRDFLGASDGDKDVGKNNDDDDRSDDCGHIDLGVHATVRVVRMLLLSAHPWWDALPGKKVCGKTAESVATELSCCSYIFVIT
jgi:hypothetical protein